VSLALTPLVIVISLSLAKACLRYEKLQFVLRRIPTMLTLIALMAIAGLMGATINMAVSSEPRSLEKWGWSAIAGVGAAFLVPLFLRTVSSELLKDVLLPNPASEDLLVFGGFCLLAAISSKRFIESLSEQVLREAREQTQNIRAQVGELSQRTDNASNLALAVAETIAPAVPPRQAARAAEAARSIKAGSVRDDPWKGQFGGSSTAKDRRLEAKLSPVEGDSQIMTVNLQVTSVDHAKPLTGNVIFYLHPTFPQNIRTVEVKDGKAAVNLVSYGAFTVGALCDEGEVTLELDLSTLPDAKEPWRSR
jgi:hypothetical protein